MMNNIDEVGCRMNSSEDKERGSCNVVANQRKGFFKLWICDIQTASASPTSANAIIFKNIQIDFVHVFGTVTKITEFITKTLIELDDATGTINCVYFKKDILENDGTSQSVNLEYCTSNNKEVTTAIDNVSKWLQKEISKHENEIQNEKEIFKLGDTVCLKGALRYFYGREIRILQMHKINNLDEETTHIIDKVEIYTNQYNRL